MGQKTLTHIARKQEGQFTCWAACTRTVYQMYKGKDLSASDTELAKTCGLPTTKCQNIQPVLETHKLYAGQDDSANIPKFEEIVESIDAGQPLIVCVTTAQVSFTEDITDGHYIVIVGYNDETNQIAIMDPAQAVGCTNWHPYDPTKYKPKYGEMFWGCTYYTQAPG